MESKKKTLAWHFLKEDRVMRDGKEAPPIGKMLTHKGWISICESGLHASKDILDALEFSPGPHLCRVECLEIECEHDDKLVCCKRTILAEADITTELHIFAIWCAEQALDLIDKPDPRSLEALRVKRLWLDGKASDEELAAACGAARAAAWDAAGDAARAAQRAKLLELIEPKFKLNK